MPRGRRGKAEEGEEKNRVRRIIGPNQGQKDEEGEFEQLKTLLNLLSGRRSRNNVSVDAVWPWRQGRANGKRCQLQLYAHGCHRSIAGMPPVCLSVRHLVSFESFSICKMYELSVALLLPLSHKFQHWMLWLG